MKTATICLALLAVPAAAQEVFPLASLLEATHIHGIAASGKGPDRVTLATHHGVFSVDLAAKTAAPIGASRDDFMGFSPVPSRPEEAFASGHPAGGGNLGVIRTTDGGQTWQQVSEGVGGPVDFHNMEVSRADPAVIYGLTHDGAVQRSADAGRTWAMTGTAPDKLIDIATTQSAADTIYAGTEDGLFVSTDSGATWSALVEGKPVTTVDEGPDGTLRATIFGRGAVGVAVDGTTKPLTAEVPDGYLLYLATVGTDPLRLMALSGGGALVISDDGGRSWRNALD